MAGWLLPLILMLLSPFFISQTLIDHYALSLYPILSVGCSIKNHYLDHTSNGTK